MNQPLPALVDDRAVVVGALEAVLGPVFSTEIPSVSMAAGRYCDRHGLLHVGAVDAANGVTRELDIDPHMLSERDFDNFSDVMVIHVCERALSAVFN